MSLIIVVVIIAYSVYDTVSLYAATQPYAMLMNITKLSHVSFCELCTYAKLDYGDDIPDGRAEKFY